MGGETCYSLLLFVSGHLLTSSLCLLSAIQIVPFNGQLYVHDEIHFCLPHRYTSVTAGRM